MTRHKSADEANINETPSPSSTINSEASVAAAIDPTHMSDDDIHNMINQYQENITNLNQELDRRHSGSSSQ